MMNVERRQAAANPQKRPNNRGFESACRLPEATLTITIYYFIIITQLKSWYSFYHPMEGRRLSRPRQCSKGVQSEPKAVYRSDVYDKHATAHGGIRTLVLSHSSQARYHSTTATCSSQNSTWVKLELQSTQVERSQCTKRHQSLIFTC